MDNLLGKRTVDQELVARAAFMAGLAACTIAFGIGLFQPEFTVSVFGVALCIALAHYAGKMDGG